MSAPNTKTTTAGAVNMYLQKMARVDFIRIAAEREFMAFTEARESKRPGALADAYLEHSKWLRIALSLRDMHTDFYILQRLRTWATAVEVPRQQFILSAVNELRALTTERSLHGFY